MLTQIWISLAQEAIALNQLYKSISPEMRYKCIAGQCITVAQAVDMIEVYESVMGTEGSKKKNVVRMTREEPENQPSLRSLERGLSEIQQSMKQVVERVEKLETIPQQKRGCFLCKSTDHFMRYCPMNKNQSTARGQSYRNTNKNMASSN